MRTKARDNPRYNLEDKKPLLTEILGLSDEEADRTINERMSIVDAIDLLETKADEAKEPRGIRTLIDAADYLRDSIESQQSGKVWFW